jgi:hypothetical protein
MWEMRNGMTDSGVREARQRARERSEAYRQRRRQGRVVTVIEVGARQLAALERLALLDVGDRDKASIGRAVCRFLEVAPHLSAMGDALWPEADEPR